MPGKCMHGNKNMRITALVTGVRSRESESPGVVATSQESELESKSIKLSRLRLRVFHYNLTALGQAKNIFFCETFGKIAVFLLSEPTLAQL